MSYFININDFKGRYKISASTYKIQDFQAYLDQVEKQLIVEDFGITFYDDLALNISKEKYQDLLVSGYKDYLLGVNYFYYVRDAFTNTSTGNVKLNNSNSNNLTPNMDVSIPMDRFNLGVDYFNRGAMDFLNDNAVKSLLIKTASDLSGGLMFLELEEVEYLYVNDIVTINKVDYTVQSVDDVNDTITLFANGIKPGQKVIYTPFTSSYFEKKQLISPF